MLLLVEHPTSPIALAINTLLAESDNTSPDRAALRENAGGGDVVHANPGQGSEAMHTQMPGADDAESVPCAVAGGVAGGCASDVDEKQV